MKINIKHAIWLLVCLILASCNSRQEMKNNNTSDDSKSTLTESPAPSGNITSLENKLMQDSLNINLRTMLAANYYSAGELKKAEDHFLIIYRLDSNNIVALSNLGNIYYDTKENEKAIQFYQKALAIAPDNIDLKCDLATCYSRVNKLKKAIGILRENIKTNFKHKQSHYNLSIILKQSGKINEANEEMKIFEALSADNK